MLRRLAGRYRLGIITNAEERYRRPKIRRLALEGYFGHVAISGSLGIWKPDRRIFHAALSALEVEPAEAVFVGDRLDPAGPQPDATIERFAELPAVLARW